MQALRPVLLVSLLGLAACTSTSNAPEPSPLPGVDGKVKPSVLWKEAVGGKTDYRFQPAFDGELVAVIGGDSELALLERSSGKKRWQIKLEHDVAGGVAISGGLIAVGTIKGEVLAFDMSGKLVWTAKTSSEIISAPVLSNNLVLARSGDGKISAFSAVAGELKWIYQRPQPALLLRNYAPPVVADGVAYIGQAAGRLSAINVADGRVIWEAPISLPRGASELERVTDIVAPPVVSGDMVCAVAYQGRVACLSAQQGSLLWTRDVASWAGLAIDAQHVYITDSKGQINALERNSGRSVWRQDALAHRFVSAPAVLGNNVLVGDMEGYLHYLNTEDGRLVAQLPTDGGRIYLAPQSAGSQVLAQTAKGSVYLLGAQ